MRIDQSGQHRAAGSVYDLVISRRRKIGANRSDFTLFDQDNRFCQVVEQQGAATRQWAVQWGLGMGSLTVQGGAENRAARAR
jgi:hypothetical protein